MPVKRKPLTSQWVGCSVRVRLRCIHCLLNSLGGNEPMRNQARLYAVLLGLALIFGGRARADDPTCEDFGMFPGGQKAACDDSCSETCKRKQNCGGNQCPGGYCWACPAPKDPPQMTRQSVWILRSTRPTARGLSTLRLLGAFLLRSTGTSEIPGTVTAALRPSPTPLAGAGAPSTWF